MLGTWQEGFNGLGQHLVTMPEDTTMKQKSQSKTEKYVVTMNNETIKYDKNMRLGIET